MGFPEIPPSALAAADQTEAVILELVLSTILTVREAVIIDVRDGQLEDHGGSSLVASHSIAMLHGLADLEHRPLASICADAITLLAQLCDAVANGVRPPWWDSLAYRMAHPELEGDQ